MGNLTKDEIIKIISKKVEKKEIERSIIYWNSTVYNKGDRVNIGPKVLAMPFKGYITIIDLEPEAKQYHTTRVFLININTKGLFTFSTRLDSTTRNFLDNNQILLKHGKIPEQDQKK